LTHAQIESTRWSATEFERLVLDSKPKVAVFDCDGTLWSGDAGFGFMEWTLEQGLVSRSTCDWIDGRHRAYRAGEVSELEICGEMVQIYAGLREQELRAAAAQYVDEFVRPRIFAEMLSLITTLPTAGWWQKARAISASLKSVFLPPRFAYLRVLSPAKLSMCLPTKARSPRWRA
jgi:phosphoserine phosphatase